MHVPARYPGQAWEHPTPYHPGGQGWSQVSPRHPAAQTHRPLSAQQEELFAQGHRSEHCSPKWPAGHCVSQLIPITLEDMLRVAFLKQEFGVVVCKQERTCKLLEQLYKRIKSSRLSCFIYFGTHVIHIYKNITKPINKMSLIT